MVWNRAVFLPPHCSPFCSVWCSSRPQRTSTTLIAYTSVFILMGACSTWGVCKPTQRPWNYWSGSCCVLTMPSSLLTQRQLCSESRPVFQKLLRSLALKSAWRRRKFCISSHHKKCTIHQAFPSNKQNWRLSTTSATCGAWSRLTPRLTKKLITGWPRQTVASTVHSADHTDVSGRITTSKKTRRSVYTKLLCWPLSCIVLSPGSRTVITWDSLSVSISAASAQSLTFIGVTSLPTLKSLS